MLVLGGGRIHASSSIVPVDEREKLTTFGKALKAGGVQKRHAFARAEVQAFIMANMPAIPAPSVPELRLHLAHPSSHMWRLDDPDASESPSPYWAYVWAGGAALARHFIDHPQLVRGRRVLDLGAGSGLVAIAAAMAGAASVTAAEIDQHALAALELNAAENNVPISIIGADITATDLPPVDVVAVGDLFYEQELARRVTGFLDRCLAANCTVLIGDPGRTYLPNERLRQIAHYAVADFGSSNDVATRKMSGVFVFEARLKSS